MIYHVTNNTDWAKAQEQGFHSAASLETEGFIHCSRPEQVAGVLKRYFTGVPGLLLLNIDEEKLTAPWKYEMAPSVQEEFPHIFGPINLDAVIKVDVL
jgi:uncharacterized protein (DUF952 family)